MTASRNRFGQYFRSRATPVQPRTPKATINRAGLVVGSSGWKLLTGVQRSAWNDYAAGVTRSDRIGSSYSPTGASLYTGSAVIAQGSAVTDPPNALPTFTLQIAGLTYVSPAPGPEALNLQVELTSSTNAFIAQTSGPVSPGLTSAAAVRRWRSLPSTSADTYPTLFTFSANPVTMLAAYKRLFPSPSGGQVIWFRFREIFFDGASAAGITNRLWQTFRLEIS